jgi:acyl carrier protein
VLIGPETASNIVVAALEEYNRGVEPELRLSTEPAAALYGPGGGLDSLGLLDLITILEAELSRELGRPVAIVEESMSTDGAAFRTVDSLIAAVAALLAPRSS